MAKTPEGVYVKYPGTPKETWKYDRVRNGKRFQESSKIYLRDFPTRREFVTASNRWYQELEQGFVGGKYHHGYKTVGEVLLSYWEENSPRISDTVTQEHILDTWNDYAGTIEARYISKDHPSVTKLVRDLQKKGRANKTINNYLAGLQAALSWAGEKRDEWNRPWLENPPRLKKLPVAGGRGIVLSRDEQKSLLMSLPTDLARMSLFALQTGLRDGELCSLAKTQILTNGGMVCLSTTRLKQKGQAKGEEMLIPLNSVARGIVSTQMSTPGPWLFPSRFGKPYSRMLSKDWRDARKEIGLPDLRVHDLRHTFASCLAHAGVPLPSIKYLMGHSMKSLGVTGQYLHVNLEQELEHLERLVDNERTLRW